MKITRWRPNCFTVCQRICVHFEPGAWQRVAMILVRFEPSSRYRGGSSHSTLGSSGLPPGGRSGKRQPIGWSQPLSKNDTCGNIFIKQWKKQWVLFPDSPKTLATEAWTSWNIHFSTIFPVFFCRCPGSWGELLHYLARGQLDPEVLAARAQQRVERVRRNIQLAFLHLWWSISIHFTDFSARFWTT